MSGITPLPPVVKQQEELSAVVAVPLRPLLFFIAVLFGPSLSVAAELDSRPNVLLIMADDLGVECLGSYGGVSYSTPNLDQLAANGLRFTNAFATPLCSTTRVELMTGRSSHRDWIGFGLMNPKSRTFGHVFQDAGYRTGIFGKWQLTSYDPPDYPGAELRRGTGMRIKNAGFDSFALFHTGETEVKGSRYANPTFDVDGSVSTFDDGYGPDVAVDEAIRFLNESDKTSEKPWFVYYPMMLPHWPMVPTPDSADWQDRTKRHDESTAYFPDMVAKMDAIVAQLWQAAEQATNGRPTLVLFYSDNGTHLKIASNTEDGWKPGGKGLSTDAGTRVPLIAFMIGQTATEKIAAGTTDAIVGPVDFLPTLLDFAEIEESRGHLDGISFAPVLDGQAGQRDDWCCHYEPRPGWDKDQFTKLVFAQTARYKRYSDGRFYDTVVDVYENRPLPQHEWTSAEATVNKQLSAALKAYLVPKPLP